MLDIYENSSLGARRYSRRQLLAVGALPFAGLSLSEVLAARQAQAGERRRDTAVIFFQAFSALIEDLHQRGLAERVLVVACGEFGRNPRIDKNAGRGHWPRAMTAVLAGGGIRAGQVIGSTTADGGEPADRPLLPGDLLASIYRVLGIDHEQTLSNLQNRPVRLVDAGEPIRELF